MRWLIGLTGSKVQRPAAEGERYKRGGDVQSCQDRQEDSEERVEEDDYKTDIWYASSTPHPNTRGRSMY